MKNKKAMSMNEAPMVIVIVGLTFLLMATIALVSESYQDALPANTDVTVTGETVTPTDAGVALAGASQINAQSFAITSATNSTGTLINSGNYSVTDGGTLTNLTSEFTTTAWTVNYTYSHTGVSGNVTTDLSTEISNNTSIAGIVLTISLVGIVLTVLIGVFVGIRKGI